MSKLVAGTSAVTVYAAMGIQPRYMFIPGYEPLPVSIPFASTKCIYCSIACNASVQVEAQNCGVGDFFTVPVKNLNLYIACGTAVLYHFCGGNELILF